jgi:hypothetical protein
MRHMAHERLFRKRRFKVQRSGFKVKHTPEYRYFFMRRWMRYGAPGAAWLAHGSMSDSGILMPDCARRLGEPDERNNKDKDSTEKPHQIDK